MRGRGTIIHSLGHRETDAAADECHVGDRERVTARKGRSAVSFINERRSYIFVNLNLGSEAR